MTHKTLTLLVRFCMLSVLFLVFIRYLSLFLNNIHHWHDLDNEFVLPACAFPLPKAQCLYIVATTLAPYNCHSTWLPQHINQHYGEENYVFNLWSARH
jgi:hypothetical protein